MNNELFCYTKMPRETQKSFTEFKAVRDLPPQQRNLRKVAEHNLQEQGVCQNRSDYDKLLKREHSRLQKLSERWKWFLRFELYDHDKQLELMQKQDATFYNMSNVLIDIIEGLLKYANNLLAEVISGTKVDGEPLATGTKIRYTKEITDILKNSHDLLCKACGRPSEYTKLAVDANLGGTLEVKETKTEEELLEEYEDYFKQVESSPES